MGFFSSLKKNLLLKTNNPNIDKNLLHTHPQQVHAHDWKQKLTIDLRKAKPQLSIWLDIVIDNIQEANSILWKRLEFLLISLDITENEAHEFTQKFVHWVNDMGYTSISDFRSELQYQLAIVLDLEDENSEKNRLIKKIYTSLSKTREHFSTRLHTLFSHHQTLSQAFWEELEEAFIMSDIGVEATKVLINKIKKQSHTQHTSLENIQNILTNELEKIFKTSHTIIAVNPPEIILVVGVNGVGKTTTIAKLAYRMRLQGKKVLIAAADTFRAAAKEQLEVWTKRIDVSLYAKEANTDPAAVVWEALDLAVKEFFDVVLIDTAGRLHTKHNLMDELIKIHTVIQKKQPSAPHRTILIIDATSGQNALQQTKMFHSAINISDIILTKLDGTAKGGIAIAIATTYNIPITYIGLGEKMEDLRPFIGDTFAQSLLTHGALILEPQ